VLNREIPFFRICLLLCLGVIAGRFLHPTPAFCLVMTVTVAVLFLIASRFNNHPVNSVFGISFSAALFTAGMILYLAKEQSCTLLPEKNTVISATVSDFPEEKPRTLMFTAGMNCDLTLPEKEELKGSILIYLRKDSVVPDLSPGDRIIIRCIPHPVVNRGNPCEFDYQYYMESRGIRYYTLISGPDLLEVVISRKKSLEERALIIRKRIIGMFSDRGIRGERLALASAITLGDKSHLDNDQKQIFITAGIMHIMAVSGLHAVILSYFIFSVLFFMKGRYEIMRVIIAVVFLWFFAFITGLTPSVLRATIMFSFIQAGKLLRRPANSVNSVLASAVVLILMNPSVIFDAGFLLSYSAVIYIIIFFREIYTLFHFRNRLADLTWQSAAVTISAQAGTLPLTIFLFNRFPVWFILTNVIIVPVSSLLIIAGAMVPMTYPVAAISGILARVLDFLTWLTEFLTWKASSLPLASINNIGFPVVPFIILTIALFLLMWYLLKKPRISSVLPFASLLIFAISLGARDLATANSGELIVYNTGRDAAVGLRDGRRLVVYSASDTMPREVVRHISVLGLKPEQHRIDNNPEYIEFRGQKIMISDKPHKEYGIPEGTRIMIFTSSFHSASRDSFPEIPNDMLVISAGSVKPPAGSIRRGSVLSFWGINEKGAYRRRM